MTSKYIISRLGECFDLTQSILLHRFVVVVNRGTGIDTGDSSL